MEKSGLVSKVPDPQYKNRVIIRLTEKGRSIYLSARERNSFNRIMSGLTARKRKQLMNLLDEVWRNAQQGLGEEDKDIHPWDIFGRTFSKT